MVSDAVSRVIDLVFSLYVFIVCLVWYIRC